MKKIDEAMTQDQLRHFKLVALSTTVPWLFFTLGVCTAAFLITNNAFDLGPISRSDFPSIALGSGAVTGFMGFLMVCGAWIWWPWLRKQRQ